MRKATGFLLFACMALSLPARSRPAASRSAFFTTSDGVRLHYLEAGAGETAIVFVPGWTMPADIWEKQIAYFSAHTRVLALDPRSQGDSDKPTFGHFPLRRARDVKELLEHAKVTHAVLVGWSLAVQELFAYMGEFGPQ